VEFGNNFCVVRLACRVISASAELLVKLCHGNRPIFRENETLIALHAGFADLLHPDSVGDHRSVDDDVLSAVRYLLLLRRYAGTRVSA